VPLTTFREPPAATLTRYVARSNGDSLQAGLRALTAPPIPSSWRITSFSTLTKEKHAHGTPSPVESGGLAAAVSALPSPPTVTSSFAGAPAGAAVGTAVHDWIEAWDLSPPDSDALARHIKNARLPAPREGQSPWLESLGELFSHLRLIRLPGCGDTPLHALCAEPHGSEWHFHLPLAGSLTVADLARCFAEFAEPAHRPYAASLSALSDEHFQGLLQGFIDRLARHGRAWGVIDWKTNRLGSNLSDYDPPALLAAAMKEHYLLQTHLYLVALRRYLRALGLVDHSIAGAWLVFLRAIERDSTRGVLHIHPPVALLDALDALFAPGGASA
jgi:exodeoxyribonuclease V beta subunit